jgi:hypothetical protein
MGKPWIKPVKPPKIYSTRNRKRRKIKRLKNTVSKNFSKKYPEWQFAGLAGIREYNTEHMIIGA